MKRSFHHQAFWLYGVIVGLALEQALVTAGDSLIPKESGAWSGDPLDAMRLIVFMVVTIRFYLGSVVYYDKAYLKDDENETGEAREAREKAYRYDFLSGLLHFLLIFGWALTLRPDTHLDIYLYAGSVVLLFDVLWGLICRHEEGKTMARWWMWVNLATFVVCGAAYLLVYYPLGFGRIPAEYVVLGLVLLISLLDITETIKGRAVFSESVRAKIPDAR